MGPWDREGHRRDGKTQEPRYRADGTLLNAPYSFSHVTTAALTRLRALLQNPATRPTVAYDLWRAVAELYAKNALNGVEDNRQWLKAASECLLEGVNATTDELADLHFRAALQALERVRFLE